MNKYIDEAKSIRAAIDGLAEGQPAEKLINNKAAFQFWNGDGVYYAIGDILQYADKLYRVIQAHTSQKDWSPDVAVSLFVEISVEEYPEWKQPQGAHDAYKMGAKCSHNGKHWQSDIDNNVYEPGVYGWTEEE